MSQGSAVQSVRDVIVVGAGPAGLAAAIAAAQAGLDCEVIERGAVVNSILNFPTHMGFFTTPELLEIGGLPFVTPYQKPTRDEALRYYRRAVDTYKLNVDLGHDVEAIRRVEDAAGQPLLEVDTRHPLNGTSRRRAREAQWARRRARPLSRQAARRRAPVRQSGRDLRSSRCRRPPWREGRQSWAGAPPQACGSRGSRWRGPPRSSP